MLKGTTDQPEGATQISLWGLTCSGSTGGKVGDRDGENGDPLCWEGEPESTVVDKEASFPSCQGVELKTGGDELGWCSGCPARKQRRQQPPSLEGDVPTRRTLSWCWGD